MIRQSESIAHLSGALVGAQADLTNAPKSSTGQVGNAKTRYTDLPTLIDHVRPILAKHRLGFLQFPCNTLAGHVGLCTRLVHESGEWLEDECSMPAGNGAQAYGSALSYSRRYSLMAVLGIAGDDDDDGAAASQGQGRARAPAAPKPPADPGTVTPEQIKKMMALFNELGIKSRDARLGFIGDITRPVASSNDLTVREGRQVIDALIVAVGARPATT